MKRDLARSNEGEEELDARQGDHNKEADDSEDDDVGPTLPVAGDVEAPVRKRRRVILNAKKFYEELPQLERYARSFMHRDALSSVTVTPQTNFVITTSVDGFVKFWKKMPTGIEFVKQYRAHLGPVTATAASVDGTLYASACATEKTIKAFDVVNFDLFTMLQLDYTPVSICWVNKRGQGEALLAVSDADTPTVRIYDLRGDTEPVHTIDDLHAKPVRLLSYNAKFHCVVSCDELGNLEYWTPDGTHAKPDSVFDLKSSTDLWEFRKSKSLPTCITMSPDCESFATMSFPDREVRIFKFRSGKITRKYDESLGTMEEMHKAGTAMVKLDDIEFGRRLAVERELEKTLSPTTTSTSTTNVIFDESGLFIFYTTLLGVKVVNTNSNACVKVYARDEKLRVMMLSLYQGAPKKQKSTTLAMAASDNPLLAESLLRDPILFATSYQKNRFYLFASHSTAGSERDAFNEKPTTSDDLDTQQESSRIVLTGSAATLHTSAGDIKVKLFATQAPKAVENFVTHAKHGYYDGTIFHRTIKQFMIQGGDPEGTGTGGASIWQTPFEDEFNDALKHETYTLSMANAGPNTNGSQFFITTAETPHLDRKHTVFGRVVAGFDVVHKVENAPVGKLDRPRSPVDIHSIEISSS